MYVPPGGTSYPFHSYPWVQQTVFQPPVRPEMFGSYTANTYIAHRAFRMVPFFFGTLQTLPMHMMEVLPPYLNWFGAYYVSTVGMGVVLLGSNRLSHICNWHTRSDIVAQLISWDNPGEKQI